MKEDRFDPLTAKFIAAVIAETPTLSDGEMSCWINNPAKLHLALKCALLEPPNTNELATRRVWKEIPVRPTGGSVAIVQELLAAGYVVEDSARDLLSITKAATPGTEETSLSLIKVSHADLGLDERAPLKLICDRAFELDLQLCPPSGAARLLLMHSEKKALLIHPSRRHSLRLILATQPLTDSLGRLNAFTIERAGSEGADSHIRLGTCLGYQDQTFASGKTYFLFSAVAETWPRRQ